MDENNVSSKEDIASGNIIDASENITTDNVVNDNESIMTENEINAGDNISKDNVVSINDNFTTENLENLNEEPISDNSSNDKKGFSLRKTMNSIGWKYGLMGIVYIVVEIGIAKLFSVAFPNFYEKHAIYIQLAMVVFTVDMVCFPFIWLLTSKMPKANIEKRRLGFGKFILCLLIMYGLIGIGVIFGMILHYALTLPFSDNPLDSGLLDLMLGSNPFIRILVVGILAPIFEELIFRKVLIDHVAPKGELVAILASGLMFGLFHGNFQQGFFTAFVGCLFAYIYLKTGRVIYTIALHMILNCLTSGITVGLVNWYYKIAAENNIDVNTISQNTNELLNLGDEVMLKLSLISFLLVGWILLLLLLVLAGIISLIVVLCMKKVKITRKEEHDPFGRQFLSLVTSPCMWIFYAVCMFLFGNTYLPDIINKISDIIKR